MYPPDTADSICGLCSHRPLTRSSLRLSLKLHFLFNMLIPVWPEQRVRGIASRFYHANIIWHFSSSVQRKLHKEALSPGVRKVIFSSDLWINCEALKGGDSSGGGQATLSFTARTVGGHYISVCCCCKWWIFINLCCLRSNVSSWPGDGDHCMFFFFFLRLPLWLHGDSWHTLLNCRSLHSELHCIDSDGISVATLLLAIDVNETHALLLPLRKSHPATCYMTLLLADVDKFSINKAQSLHNGSFCNFISQFFKCLCKNVFYSLTATRGLEKCEKLTRLEMIS